MVKSKPTYDELKKRVRELEKAVTESKQAAEVLRLSDLLEQLPDGILLIDPPTSRFLEFNTAAHRQLGYTREEFAQLSIFDLEAKETTEETKARISEVLQKGKADFETLQRTKQGEIRNVHVIAQIINVLGHPAYQCIWRDVTERNIAEASLHESEQKIRAVLDATPFPIAVVDLEDNRIHFWSESAHTLFGHTAPTSSEWYQIGISGSRLPPRSD